MPYGILGDIKCLDNSDTDIEGPLTIVGVVFLVLSVASTSGLFDSHDLVTQGDSTVQKEQ